MIANIYPACPGYGGHAFFATFVMGTIVVFFVEVLWLPAVSVKLLVFRSHVRFWLLLLRSFYWVFVCVILLLIINRYLLGLRLYEF